MEMDGTISSERLPLAVSISFADMFDSLCEYIGTLNHNLNPNPDREDDPLSWDDRTDRTYVNFSVAAAAQRVRDRLSDRGARLHLTATAAELTFRGLPSEFKYAALIADKIRYYIRLAVYVDKLTMCVGRVPASRTLRDELSERATMALEDLVCVLCLLDNEMMECV